MVMGWVGGRRTGSVSEGLGVRCCRPHLIHHSFHPFFPFQFPSYLLISLNSIRRAFLKPMGGNEDFHDQILTPLQEHRIFLGDVLAQETRFIQIGMIQPNVLII